MGFITGALQRTEGENMAEFRSSSYTSSSELVGQQMQDRTLEREVRRTQLYIAMKRHPVPPYLYLASMPPRPKAIARTYSSDIARRKQNANRASQVIWAFTVVIKPSSILNIRSRSLSGLVQEHSWLRNYHLGEVDVFVLLRGAKRFVMQRPCHSIWATQRAEELRRGCRLWLQA